MRHSSPLRRVTDWHRVMGRHVRLRALIDSYVDGELDAPQRAQVAAHLTECPLCGARADTLSLIKRSLRTSPQRLPTPLAQRRLRRYAQQLAGTEHTPIPVDDS